MNYYEEKHLQRPNRARDEIFGNLERPLSVAEVVRLSRHLGQEENPYADALRDGVAEKLLGFVIGHPMGGLL